MTRICEFKYEKAMATMEPNRPRETNQSNFSGSLRPRGPGNSARISKNRPNFAAQENRPFFHAFTPFHPCNTTYWLPWCGVWNRARRAPATKRKRKRMAWEVKRDGGTKFMFCYVSGGYVMIGTREKNNPLNTSSDSCYVEEFSSHTGIQNAIRQVCATFLILIVYLFLVGDASNELKSEYDTYYACCSDGILHIGIQNAIRQVCTTFPVLYFYLLVMR